MKIILQPMGQYIGYAIEGTPAEIRGEMTALFNHGATDATEPLSLGSENFAYVVCNLGKLQSALIERELARLDSPGLHINELERLRWLATERALARLESAPRESFLRYGDECVASAHNIGTME